MAAKITLADHIQILQGDLVTMDTDAIVNAANNDLQLGGGVAGAIRRSGGPQIQKECDEIGPVPVGGAAITSGGNLKARYVIHAASMQLGGRTSAQSLRSSTAHALRIAAQKELKTIAFPAVGTGIAGFPMRECAEIMLREAAKHFEGPTSLQKIYFVLFDQEALAVFNSVRAELESKASAMHMTQDLLEKVQAEVVRYEHPLFDFAARPAEEGVEVEIRYKPKNTEIHDYTFLLRPREIEHTQFPWTFQKQLYDCLHDYIIEMFTRNPQRVN